MERSKQTLPEYSFFGDNNWRRIDERIDVLRGQYLDEDEIYDQEDDLEDAGTMVNVLEWMNGDGDESEFIDEDDK